MSETQQRDESTEVVKHEDVAAVMDRGGRFDLSEVGDPTAGLETARKLVSYMAKKCTGPEYIANIQGKRYPKVDWWTTVGGGLGLFPREESCRKLDRAGGEIAYEATVGVYNGDQIVTRASAICSSDESTWSGRDEYAIRSMAITRATGKAYRVGLSFLPVMAGLEPTPAEEMPGQRSTGGGGKSSTSGADTSDLRCPDCGGPIWDNRDDDKSAANGGKRPNFKCKDKDCDWASWDSEDEVFGSEEGYEWADPLEDFPELQSAVRELESLNEERGANARTWLEGITGELSEDPQAVQDALERLERGISEERDGGTDDSGAEPADPASEDEGPDKSEWADRAEVLTWLHDEYGDEWEGKLNFFLATHPEISVEGQHENLDKMGWNRIKRFIDEHGREGIEDPRSYVQGQLEGV